MMVNNTSKTPTRASNSASNTSSNASIKNEVVFVAFLDLSMLLQPNCIINRSYLTFVLTWNREFIFIGTAIRCLSIVHNIDVEIVKQNELSFKNFDLGKLIKTNIKEDLKKVLNHIFLHNISLNYYTFNTKYFRTCGNNVPIVFTVLLILFYLQ